MSSKKWAYHSSVSAFSSYQNRSLRKKPIVLDQLIDRLEKMGIAKYERKKTFDMGVQEIKLIKILKKIKRIVIQEESKVKKNILKQKKSWKIGN